MNGFGSAPGKIILSGEHSVVYKKPAIAAAIDLRCEVTSKKISNGIEIDALDLGLKKNYSFDDIKQLKQNPDQIHGIDSLAILADLIVPGESLSLKIHSQIPISAGLGSSAATAVSVAASISDLFSLDLSLEQISNFAYQSEVFIHGKPSGIDNSIATWGGLIVYENSHITRKTLNHTMPLIIANTQVERSTAKLVQGVSNLRNKYTFINPLIDIFGELTNNVITSIDKGDMNKLGELFNINQGLLDAINVGHRKLSEFIWIARDAGAIGAKLTGAGGGGCMIALARNDKHAEEIANKLEDQGARVYITSLSSKGVQVGK